MSVTKTRPLQVADLGGIILDYVEKTTDTTVNQTTEAAANTVVTSSSITVDGSTEIEIEFGCFGFAIAAASSAFLALFDNGSSIGQMGQWGNANASGPTLVGPITTTRRLVPSAGSHTYSIRAYGGGAGTVYGGAGGSGAKVPAYIKIKRVSRVVGPAGIAGITGGYAPLDSGLMVPRSYLNLSPGRLLGATQVQTGSTISTSSSTPLLVSATLDNTVTVSSSGKIACQIGANWQMASGFNGYVVVLEGTTNKGEAVFWSSGNSPAGMYATHTILISGITPGSHTYRVAIRTNGGGTMSVLNLSLVTFLIFDWP